MANVDKPSGFKPVCHLNGVPWNGKVNIYYHSASDGTAIFKGDLVQVDGTNVLASGMYPAVKQHVAGQTDNVGVAVGFGNTPQIAARLDNLNAVNYCPASTAMYIAVVDDPSVLFEIQEDSAGGYIPATDLFGYGDVVVGSGSTSTGTSAMEIDSSDVDHSAAATLQIVRLVNRDDNELGNYAKWLVRINEHITALNTLVA